MLHFSALACACVLLPLVMPNRLKVDIGSSEYTSGVFLPTTAAEINSFGSVAAIRYTIETDGWESGVACHDIKRKILVMAHMSNNYDADSEMLLSFVRLDSVPDPERDGREDKRCPVDLEWKGHRGWPNKLEVNVDTLGGSSYILDVPPLIDGDYMSVRVQLPGFRRPIYNSDVPRNLFRSGRDTNGHSVPIVEKLHSLLQLQHQEWTITDTPLDEFEKVLQELEGQRAVDALNALQPNAFKADLFRLVVLYHYGGVWLDSKIVPIGPLDEWLPHHGSLLTADYGIERIFNGAMIFPQYNALARAIIDMMLDNVERRDYGTDMLDITGPVMHYTAYVRGGYVKDTKNYSMAWHLSVKGAMIYDEPSGEATLAVHNMEYRRHAVGGLKKCHYGSLWNQRAVFYEKVCDPVKGLSRK